MSDNQSNKAAFIEAVKEGDAAQAAALLSRDANLRAQINAPWFDFDAPAIVYSAGAGHREMVDVLLQNDADIDIKSDWWAGGVSAMNWVTGSMMGYNRELAEYLVERGATIDAHAAAGLDLPDKLHALIDENPDVVNERGPDGMTALHFAATPQIAALLLERGAEIDIQDIDHHGTAAQWTVSRRPDVSRYLVEQGAEADVILCCAIGDAERTRRLLAANPDLLEARVTGEAPGGHVYFYTVGRALNLLQVALDFNHLAVADVLLDAGYQIPLEQWYNIVGLGAKNMDKLVKRFMDHGLDLDSRRQHRLGLWAPLHYLAHRGLTIGIACLLNNGANPNVTDREGRTPLHTIARKGVGKNQVDLLTKNGADMNARDTYQRTPRDYADEASRDSIARYLAALGAGGNSGN